MCLTESFQLFPCDATLAPTVVLRGLMWYRSSQEPLQWVLGRGSHIRLGDMTSACPRSIDPSCQRHGSPPSLLRHILHSPRPLTPATSGRRALPSSPSSQLHPSALSSSSSPDQPPLPPAICLQITIQRRTRCWEVKCHGHILMLPNHQRLLLFLLLFFFPFLIFVMNLCHKIQGLALSCPLGSENCSVIPSKRYQPLFVCFLPE